MSEVTERQRILRLLIVEDDQAQLRTLTAIMEDEGFEVVGCTTASAALEQLNREDIGVAVVDLRLPDLSGTELLEKLRERGSRINVIINTAYASLDTAKDAVNLGAFAYVEKGGDPEELVRRVHRAFRARLERYTHDLEDAVAERTRELREANETLKQEITERKQAETDRERLLHDLGERVKELRCMYGVAESIRKRATLEQVFRETVALIASVWHDSKITRVRIRLGGEEYESEPFEETEWSLSSDVVVAGERCGAVEVFYLEERPDVDDGPFLAEERNLIDGVARALSEAIDRKLAVEALNLAHADLTQIFNAAVPMCVIDRDFKILRVNDTYCSFFAVKRDDVVGGACHEIWQGPICRTPQCPLPQIIAGAERCEHEVTEKRFSDGRTVSGIVTTVPYRDARGELVGIVQSFTDITHRKRAEAELEELHQQLVQASRQAGMSEVATGVLHNVGNVLNSVNVSAGLVNDKIRGSRIPRLAKAAALMSEHADDLGTFITKDERGKQLPGYLAKLAEHLAGEQADVLGELRHLTENIEHIKVIVSMQQSLTGVSGVTEPVRISDVLDDLLKMDASSLDRQDIKVVREYDEVPVVSIDKHRLTQILVNLLKNAKDALTEDQGPDKRLTLRIRRVPRTACLPVCSMPTDPTALADKPPVAPDHVRIEVADNAVGIPPENRTKIFAYGFTTKEGGHGFGLHGSALAATELGGSLTAHSDGPGQGATFTLELPLPVTETSDARSAG